MHDEAERYVDALLRQAEREWRRTAGRALQTIFFGGGTPSLMPIGAFERLMDGLLRIFPSAEAMEVTLEANPGTTDESRFEAYRRAGVTRLSLGVQSFDSRALARLGRIHDGEAARRAAAAAVRTFEHVNLDLMFALPQATMDDLERDLETAVSFGTDHLSCYQLTIEDNTAFAKRPPEGMPDEDAAAKAQELVVERLAAAGFERYEVSAYARAGARCRHNLNYWRFGDYVGLGAGAHGKLTVPEGVLRTQCPTSPERYMKVVLGGEEAAQQRFVSADELPFEFMLNALRLTNGVEQPLWRERTGLPDETLERYLPSLKARGLWTTTPGRLAASSEGFLFLSEVQAAFL